MWSKFVYRWRTSLLMGLTLSVGIVIGRSCTSPVVGTFEDPLPADLLGKFDARNDIFLHDVAIDDALVLLSEKYGVKLRLSESVGKRLPGRRISLESRRATLDDVLDLFQAKFSLYAVVDGSAVVFCDEDETWPSVVARVYDVRELITKLEQSTAYNKVPQSPNYVGRAAMSWIVRELMMQVIDDRMMTINGRTHILYVHATPLRHRRVAKILNHLMEVLGDEK